MRRPLLGAAEARRLWWLVHNGDPASTVRAEVYGQLKRGYLNIRLTKAERALCDTLATAEMARLAGKSDVALLTTASLLASLGGMA